MNQQTIRKNRGLTEEIYLREIKKITPLKKEFFVKAASGNGYTVTIDDSPKCTCLDYAQRSIRCKHIYYVLQKILNVTDTNVLFKETFDNNDLKVIYGLNESTSTPVKDNNSSYFKKIFGNLW